MYYEITISIPQGFLEFKREVKNSLQILNEINKITNKISEDFNLTKEEIKILKVIQVAAPYSTL